MNSASARTLLLNIVTLLTTLTLSGCGGGGTTPVVPPPGGGGTIANPAQFSASPSSALSALLTWSEVAGATRYALERKLTSPTKLADADFVPWQELSAGQLRYEDFRVPAQANVTYRIKAVSASGSSSGLESSVTTPKLTPSPLTVQATFDTARSQSAKLGAVGGSLSATGAGGVIYTLTVPANALLEDQTLTLTPLADLTDSPLSGGTLGAVRIEPEGMTFLESVRLRIELPSATPVDDYMLAVQAFGAPVGPKTETQTEAGWTSVSGGAQVKVEGNDAAILLTVLSGYGRTARIFTVLNSQIYLASLDTFMNSVKPHQTQEVSRLPSSQGVSSPGVSSQGVTVPGKFGHLTYPPMVGWQETEFSNAVSFVPTYLPPGRNLEVRIMQAKPFSGSIQQAFAESWQDVLAQLDMVSDGPITGAAYYGSETLEEKTSSQGWPYIRGQGYVVNKTGATYYLSLFVIKLNNRVERMSVVSQKIQSNGNTYSLNQFSAYPMVYDNLFFSVRFDDWKDKGTSGSLKGDGLVGLYAGLKLGHVDLNDSANSGGLEGTYLALFSNGQVYFRAKLPSEGFDGLNTQAQPYYNGRDWATYAVQGGQGVLAMPYGNIPLLVNANGVVLTTQNTKHQYVKIPSVDGAVFNGTYAFPKSEDGGPKEERSITFSANGTFDDKGALYILDHEVTYDDNFNVTLKLGSGTYQARNYSIIFTYLDGRKLQIAFSGLNYDIKNQSPVSLTLSFNDDEIFKQ